LHQRMGAIYIKLTFLNFEIYVARSILSLAVDMK
jgi:hypothetical protein